MPDPDEIPPDFPWEEMRQRKAPLYQPVGCRQCRNTGYSGRLGIYELLVANEQVRQLASERQSSVVIKNAAIAAGMRTLRQDGWHKVMQGTTTIAEVLRVTKAD
mgnify:CR=1 FL=1